MIHAGKPPAKIRMATGHSAHQNSDGAAFDTTMALLLPDLHQPGFLWLDAMDHTGKTVTRIHLSPRHPAHRERSSGDSHAAMAWSIPGLRQRGLLWPHVIQHTGRAAARNHMSPCHPAHREGVSEEPPEPTPSAHRESSSGDSHTAMGKTISWGRTLSLFLFYGHANMPETMVDVVVGAWGHRQRGAGGPPGPPLQVAWGLMPWRGQKVVAQGRWFQAACESGVGSTANAFELGIAEPRWKPRHPTSRTMRAMPSHARRVLPGHVMGDDVVPDHEPDAKRGRLSAREAAIGPVAAARGNIA
jgi:hypothetical protein